MRAEEGGVELGPSTAAIWSTARFGVRHEWERDGRDDGQVYGREQMRSVSTASKSASEAKFVSSKLLFSAIPRVAGWDLPHLNREAL